MNRGHILALQFVVEDFAVGVLHEVCDHGNEENQSRVDQKTIPPADDSFNDHGKEDPKNSNRKALDGGKAVRYNAVEGNEHIEAEEDDRVLK